jgi:V/A-type H+-transporting ATPase subunit I
MKKVTLLGLNRLQEVNLQQLRELGVVHLEKKDVQSDSLSRLLEKKAQAETAAGVLRNFAPKKEDTTAAAIAFTDGDFSAHILKLADKRKADQEQLSALGREIARIEKWGDFEPALLKELAEKGVALIPYELSVQSFSELAERRVIVLGRDKRTVFCLALGEAIPDEQVFVLPEQSLSSLKKSSAALREALGAGENELKALALQANRINDELAALAQDIEFEKAKTGMDHIEDCPAELAVSYITGYVPDPEVGVLKRAAAEHGWALYADEPSLDDVPPTLIKSNAVVRIIQPLFSFIGTIPGYNEYDISPSYLLFFSIFFAMIFGDAAYGSIIFIVSFLAGLGIRKKSGKFPDAAKLFAWLGFCTIVWGALNGSWFAIDSSVLPGFLQALVLPQFNPAVVLKAFPGFLSKIWTLPAEAPGNTAYWNIQFLCFSIALVQLVYARLKNVAKCLKSTAPAVAFSQLGWLVMMIGLYFLVLSMLLKIEMPAFAPYLMGIGIGLYFIFANQTGGNVFANVGKSFANFLPTFLNAVGSFADIISYIRLFAVGLAGTSIAQSFNSMSGAGTIGGSVGDIILKLLTAVLILVFGHGLNLMMNALSVIVHGVRLNLLEYAGNHLSMEWSGYSYKPFALRQKKTI